MRSIPETEAQVLRAHFDKDVGGAPKVVMNDAVELVGTQPEAAFVDAVLKAAA